MGETKPHQHEKAAGWLALVLVPLFYALARTAEWPTSVVLSGVLHWVLAGLVIAWTLICLSGAKEIGLPRPLLGFVCFLAVITIYCGVLILAFGSDPLAQWQQSQMHGLDRWGVVLIAITAGFCEEVIYRGYMMSTLKRTGHPVWLSMVLSTASFVLFHGILPLPLMAGFFVVGMIFAVIYQRTSSLWTVVSIHAVWDATVLLVPWDTVFA